jgi:squalene synthase HpnD
MSVATLEVERIVRASGSSFYWGMRLLPPEQRRALYAVYAFCRRADDIADAPGAPEDRLAALERWRLEVDRAYGGAPESEIGQALGRAAERFQLPREELEAVIDGMAWDVAKPPVAPERAALALYCRKVAGSVGVLTLSILGCREPRDLRLAEVLGEALQFTNILRDLKEDARRGRLYLPAELLKEAGVRAASPEAVLQDKALPRACALLAAEAEARFQEAQRLIDARGRRRLRAPSLMLAVYARLLARMRGAGWPQEARMRLPAWEKTWLALRHGVL